MESSNNSNEIKAILVGESAVGKTSLINSCVGLGFNSNPSLTLSCSFRQKKFIINKKEYIVNLWDTAGQENYLSLNKMFYRNSEIVIFVFDITDQESLYNLDKWIKNVIDELGTNFVCGIVGNKSDLYLNEKVSDEEAKKYAISKGIKYKRCSAKTDPKSFSDFLKQLIIEPRTQNKLKNDEDKNENNINNNKEKEKNDNINSNINILNRKRGSSIRNLNIKSSSEKKRKCC